MVVATGRLLERDAELERIGTLLDSTREGTGAFTFITGVPGIGKTRLGRAARAEAEDRGFHVLSARGAELEREYAFGVVRQWLEPLLRSGDDGLSLEGAAELAAPVLRGVPGESHDPSFSVLHGLYWVAAGLTERRPLVLILDDAQWADDASLRFVAFLSRRLDGLPLLVLLTAREPLSAPLAALAAEAVVLPLQPLELDGVAGFLRDRSHTVVDEAFACACRDATGGNPFLLEELTRALLAESVEFVASEKGRVPAIGPRSVAKAVLLRLASLPPEMTALARAAAVAGDDASLPVVAALAGLDETGAAAAADTLAEAAVLEDARPLRFVHPIVRSAIHEGLAAGEREALHARAAELLAECGAPAEAVAVHLLTIEPKGDEQVAEMLVEAARGAMSRGAPEAAATLLTRALAEPPAPALRANVLLELGRAEHALERTGAVDHLREAHRLAADPRERARAASLLTWAVSSSLIEQRELLEVLDRTIEEVADEDAELALELEAGWMNAAWDRGLVDAIVKRGERFADLKGSTPAECLVLAYLAHAWMDAGRPANETAPLAERAAAREFVPQLGLHSTWVLHTGVVLRQAERLDLARELLDLSISEAQAHGSLRGFVIASMFRSAVLNRAGDISGAEADARAALAAAAKEAVYLIPAVAELVDALIERARLDEATALLEEYRFSGAVPKTRHATVLLFSRSWLLAERGDLKGALADLAEARRRLGAVDKVNVVGLDGRLRSALIHSALGDADKARAEAAVAVEAANQWGTPGAIGTALRTLGLVDNDLELLRRAARELARSPLRLEHARALVDLGAALRRTGRRSEAREPLRDALALADECGGIAVREQAREELAATGIRVRREALSGVAALTASERRIAERAAAGASNRQIAQALFVTVKTVEMHLSNAYRKLGISSRHELASVLRG